VVRAPGAAHAQVVGRDRHVVLAVPQIAAQRHALLVHRHVVLGAAHALRERALVLVLVLGDLTRQHASGRRRRVR
jgi:hypothetical protein